MELYDNEAEKILLGSILSENNIIYDIDIKEHDFYNVKHKKYYNKIKKLIDDKKECNQLSLLDYFKDEARDISELSVVNSIANIEFYEKRVRDLSLRRSFKDLAQKLSLKVNQPDEEIDDIRSYLEQMLVKVSENTFDGKEHISDFIYDIVNEIEEDYKRKDPLKGITTGYNKLNIITQGFQKAQYIIVAARTGLGKSAITQGMIKEQLKAGHKVGVFTLEMSSTQYIKRILSSMSNINGCNINSGFLKAFEFEKLQTTLQTLYGFELYICDIPSMSIDKIASRCRQWKIKHNLDIVYIDYIGLIKHPNKSMKRYEQMAEISNKLVYLKRELNIPIVCVAQINRDAKDHKPQVYNIRDSGSIEQDAETICILHTENGEDYELNVAKNRYGATGTVDLLFKRETVTFFEKSKINVDRK